MFSHIVYLCKKNIKNKRKPWAVNSEPTIEALDLRAKSTFLMRRSIFRNVISAVDEICVWRRLFLSNHKQYKIAWAANFRRSVEASDDCIDIQHIIAFHVMIVKGRNPSLLVTFVHTSSLNPYLKSKWSLVSAYVSHRQQAVVLLTPHCANRVLTDRRSSCIIHAKKACLGIAPPNHTIFAQCLMLLDCRRFSQVSLDGKSLLGEPSTCQVHSSVTAAGRGIMIVVRCIWSVSPAWNLAGRIAQPFGPTTSETIEVVVILNSLGPEGPNRLISGPKKDH